MGNRVALTATTPLSGTVVTTYTYNVANQLETAHASKDGVTWYYTYDQRGNLVRQTPDGTTPAEGETRYTYNAARQLVRVELYTDGDYTTLAKAAYNGDGERVWLTTYAAGVPLTVTYGVFQEELLVADNGTQITRYLHGRSLSAEHGDEWAYHLRDGEGNVRQMVDENGVVTLARTYKPFGGILEEQGQYKTAFGFLGAQLDRSSGLLYAGGRYYDPETGRFLTPDRSFDPYNPRTLNPYAPFQDPTLWLLAPLAVIATFKGGKKRRKYGYWLLLLLVVGMGTSVILTGCEPEPTPLPTPPPTPLPTPPTPPPTPEPEPVPAPPTPTPTVPDAVLLEKSVRVLVVDTIFPCPTQDNPDVIITGHGARGLGTIIYDGDTILTHNHYEDGTPAIWDDADYIEFTNYRGEKTRVEKDDIRLDPRDPGTLLLWLPPGVNLGGTPAMIGTHDTLSMGDAMQAVYYDDGADRLKVLTTEILEFGEWEGGVPIAIFPNSSKIIGHGDSGGGLFQEDQLVGNNWYIIRGEWLKSPIFASALLPDGL